MKQFTDLIDNEKGSVLLLAMSILVLLTLIGIAATNTSKIETDIAANEYTYKRSFYASDAGVSQAVKLNPMVDPPYGQGPHGAATYDPYHTYQPSDAFCLYDPATDAPTGLPFELYYLRPLSLPPHEPYHDIEVLSISRSEKGEVRIIAGIELPSPEEAEDETSYAATY